MISDSGARLLGLLGATAVAALVLATLLPSDWVPRTGLGWRDEHFVMYLATTFILCLAWRKPYTVAMLLMACAGTLEALQGLTPDRFPDLIAVFSGAVGVLSAAALFILLVRARRWWLRNMCFRISGDSRPEGLDLGRYFPQEAKPLVERGARQGCGNFASGPSSLRVEGH
jgi:hypothetical protein